MGYSEMVQQAQQSAKDYYGGGQGGGSYGPGQQGGAAPPGYDSMLTSDPYTQGQQEFQSPLLDYYQNILTQPDLGFGDTGLRGKQELRQKEDLEKARGGYMQRGGEAGDPALMALESDYMSRSSPMMEAELGAQQMWYQNMMQQAMQNQAYGGRSRGYTPVPTGGGGGYGGGGGGGYGGTSVNYEGGRFDNPYSTDVNTAYEGNTPQRLPQQQAPQQRQVR